MKTFDVKGHTVIVDDDVFEWASIRKWTIDKSGNTFYLRCRKGRLHRMIMNVTDKNVLVDHRNHNGLDNRRGNLRICTVQQNNRNLRKQVGTSKYKGVNWKTANKKFEAKIQVNGKVIYLGLFSNETDAAIAYNKAALKYHGEFAHLNQIE